MLSPGLSLIAGPWARIRQAQCHAIFYPFIWNSNKFSIFLISVRFVVDQILSLYVVVIINEKDF